MRALVATVVVLAFAGFATAEDKVDAKKLIGKWEPAEQPKGGQMVFEFTEKGKVTIQFTFDGVTKSLEGTYKVDGNKIELTRADGKDKTGTLVVSKLTDDELVGKEESGKEINLKKIKPKK